MHGMPSTKCTVCETTFFSPDGSTKCGNCMKKEGLSKETGHDNCGCGHSH